MERAVTALASGLWSGTLAGIGLAYLVLAYPSKTNGQITAGEKAMGEGLAMLGAGILGGLFVAAIVCVLVYSFVPVDKLLAPQSISAAAIVAMIVWAVVVVNQSAPDKYLGYIGLMDVEVRLPKSQFPLKRAQELVIVALSRSIPPQRHREMREDGDWVILPTTMWVPFRHDWTVTIAAAGKGQLWFKPGWEDVPPAAIPWTDWIAPSEGEWPGQEGITVRCRWHLVPRGTGI